VSAITTTVDQLERTVASLRGLRIKHVAYAVLAGGHDGREPEQWDRHTWHKPTYGCQLTTHIGVAFTFIWNNSFGGYGIEVFDRPIEDFLAGVGEPYGPLVLEVNGDPRWCDLRGREIVAAELDWIEWVSGDPSPISVRLDLAPLERDAPNQSSVWLAAGRWRADGFAVGTADITVIFDMATAARAHLARS
jgi:hypothetical protein